jgi:hypothetical protein
MAYELMNVSERTWAALAMIESEQPKGETECAIVVQMACVHAATKRPCDRRSAEKRDELASQHGNPAEKRPLCESWIIAGLPPSECQNKHRWLPAVLNRPNVS